MISQCLGSPPTRAYRLHVERLNNALNFLGFFMLDRSLSLGLKESGRGLPQVRTAHKINIAERERMNAGARAPFLSNAAEERSGFFMLDRSLALRLNGPWAVSREG